MKLNEFLLLTLFKLIPAEYSGNINLPKVSNSDKAVHQNMFKVNNKIKTLESSH